MKRTNSALNIKHNIFFPQPAARVKKFKILKEKPISLKFLNFDLASIADCTKGKKKKRKLKKSENPSPLIST